MPRKGEAQSGSGEGSQSSCLETNKTVWKQRLHGHGTKSQRLRREKLGSRAERGRSIEQRVGGRAVALDRPPGENVRDMSRILIYWRQSTCAPR